MRIKVKTKKKTLFYTVVSAILLAVLVANVALSYLFERKTLFVDTTSEGLYTLSEGMKKEMDAVSGEVLLTFCTDPDYLMSNYESKYTYVMAKKLADRYDNIKIECINSQKNPEKLDKYKATSATEIGAYDLIVSSGGRYRILRSANMWTGSEEEYTAYNGEYKLANAILSVTAVESPLVCFTTGHGEKYYNPNDAANSNENFYEFYSMLEMAGLSVGYVNLDTEEIPDDCVMLIINGATVDYSGSPDDIYNVGATNAIEKIDRFLEADNNLFVAKDPFVSLPALEEYLLEWGLAYSDNVIQTEGTDTDPALRKRLLAQYATEDKDPIGYSLYSEVADLQAAPNTIINNASQIRLVWDNKHTVSAEKYVTAGVTIKAGAVLRASSDTLAYTEDGLIDDVDSYGDKIYLDDGENVADYAGDYILSAVSIRTKFIDTSAGNYTYAYVFATSSTDMLTNEYLGTSSYANNDILFSVVRTVTRTDRYADDSLGALNMNNVATYGGKPLLSTEMQETDKEIWESGQLVKKYAGMTKTDMVWLTIALAVIPVAVLPTLCIYVYIKRRNM